MGKRDLVKWAPWLLGGLAAWWLFRKAGQAAEAAMAAPRGLGPTGQQPEAGPTP